MNSDTMISITGLTKSYGQVQALRGIDLDVSRGEIAGLLGPNGAGKTTALRILTGYLEPTGGQVLIGGLSAHEHGQAARAQVGYLPESAPLPGHMLAYDYLMSIARLWGVGPGRIDALADLCAIREVMHQPIHALSKGYRQRVGLAHALMSDPPVLVLDEPTSGLDPNQIIEIRGLIKSLATHKTVLLSTHILSEAEAACDRIAIIHQGRIVAHGPTSQIKGASTAAAHINLTITGATLGDMKSALGTIKGVDAVEQSGERFIVTLAHGIYQGNADARAEIYLAIKAQPWVMLEMSCEGQSLEHIFKQLTVGMEE